MLYSPIGCCAHKQKTPTGSEQTRTIPRFSQSEPLLSNPFRSFDYARGNESIIYFIDLCKPIETYIYARKKHPFASYPAAKHPKHSKFAIYRHTTKNSELFLLFNTGVDFSLRNNFANLGFFAKVFVLLRSIIPCSDCQLNLELSAS